MTSTRFCQKSKNRLHSVTPEWILLSLSHLTVVNVIVSKHYHVLVEDLHFYWTENLPDSRLWLVRVGALRNNIHGHKLHYSRSEKLWLWNILYWWLFSDAGPQGFKLPQELLVALKLYLVFSPYFNSLHGNWATLFCFLFKHGVSIHHKSLLPLILYHF